MKVHVSKDDIIERPTDAKGRVTLGKKYADKHVEVAVLEVEEGEVSG